ncbi:acetyl-CoA C-acyltransferase [Nocardia sp. NPDC005978]|uniref:thiolase family protein n=1 Tax=Nocardia sp. NPDC005978 TaxID=3156725 RepID=UPI0033A3C660
MGEAYIFDAVRTPRGRVRKTGGTLAGVPSHALLGQLLSALEERSCPANAVQDIIAGVNTATGEQGGNVARAAALWAGWPDHVPGGVVSRLCCSGLDAVQSAAARIAAGYAEIVIAGGVESMSRTPMLSDRPAIAADEELGERTGFVTIGVSADLTAALHGISRAELDEFAVRSHRKAAAAPVSDSVIPVRVDGVPVLAADEGARADATLDAFAALPTLFGSDESWARVARRLPGAPHPVAGLHTLATAPQLADSASAILLGGSSAAATLGRAPVARIAGTAQTAERSPLLSATVTAARQALDRAGITAADLDVIEVNESFAVTPLLLTRELDLDPDRVNVNGGALAVGHPLGATGGILIAQALDALRRCDGEFALVTIPAALGLGSAIVVQRTG